MKLYIYILLFILIIFYVYKYSGLFEYFTNDDFTKHNYDALNMYDVLQTDVVKPIQVDNSVQVSGFNPNNNQWFVKTNGFSDIYNYEDNGGEIAHDILSNYNTYMSPHHEQPNNLEPVTKINKNAPEEIDYKGNNYKYLGTATNVYYNQYFYIFENKIEQDTKNMQVEEELKYIKNNKIYQYLLVKMHKDNKPQIIHWVGPRNKININDVVYLSLATFQLGPLVIN